MSEQRPRRAGASGVHEHQAPMASASASTSRSPAAAVAGSSSGPQQSQPVNYMNRLSDDYRDLLVSKAHWDVMIQCTDGQIKAHKLILSVRCRYFQKLFNTEEGTKACMVRVNFRYNTMQLLLEYLYTGVLQFPQSREVFDLIRATSMYDLNELAYILMNEVSAQTS